MSQEQFFNALPPINPNAVYTAGNSVVVYYTVTGTTQVHAVPKDFLGCIVTLIAEGTTVDFLFGPDSTLVVSNAVAASAAGARASTLGRQLLATQEIDVYLPATACNYIARIGAGNGQLRMVRSSANPQLVVAT